MREDTRHKIYTGSGRQESVIPYVCLGVLYIVPLRLDVEVLPHGVCPLGTQTLLYIVQGAVPSRLQGWSSSRITRYES